ncbi:MAG: alpha/beta hydrolase fold domain-containing protein [Acidimicrobiia bacterium]|nr:alpha/beta hydrolase fold domain-containing protein [Acidimicrobiia bacterium]
MSPQPYYDPEVRAAIEAGPRLGTVDARTLPKVRADRLLLNEQVQLSDAVTRTDLHVPGPPGAPDIRLRVHRPRGTEGDLPCLYWVHGGGYVLGAPEQDDLRFDRWCQRFGLVGVAVQYRLAPEHPYPAPIEDCYAGLRWVKEHGAEIGVDTGRVGIGGPSGGGGLAAALALVTRDRGEVEIDYQLLIYPMIDDTRAGVTASWDVPVWNTASNEFGWKSYLGDLYGTDDVPAHAAPSRATDLAGLPPTYIMVGTLDAFADEDIEYAQRLNHAGVPVELHVYPGAPHGFEGFAPGSALARQARNDMNNWLASRLAPPVGERAVAPAGTGSRP